MRSFLGWAELQAEDDRRSGGVGPPDPDDDAVRVMTIHGSKGLEFPVVVLAGLEREVSPGQRPPAVLWNEDGTPELRGGVRLKPLGYDDANERERTLDGLEQHRLLYVGMTRARDHLVMCLHHKETKNGTGRTEAALVYDICLRFPQLWRRLPVLEPAGADTTTASVPTASSDQSDLSDLSALSAMFGVTVASGPDAPEDTAPGEEEVSEWRSGLETFAAQRAQLLHSSRRAPVTTATAIADTIAMTAAPRSGQRPAGETRPRVREPDPGSPDAIGALWRDADTALQIGRAVHGALASIDLSTGADSAGRSPEEVARARATAQGVGAHADAISTMVGAALASPTVAAGADRRHWREVLVAVPVADGVVEGFVDLVLEEDDGLTVIDYKTERIGDVSRLPVAAARYRPQVASYALALQDATGLPVRRCVLVFVGDGRPVEDVLLGDELAEACSAARRAAGGILAEIER